MEQEQFKKEILPLREKLFLYARRLLDNPEDAEDIMQEVFLKLWYMRGDMPEEKDIEIRSSSDM